MPSTLTQPVSCRVEPVYSDALRVAAEMRGQTLSAVIADLIRTAASRATASPSSASSRV